MLASIEIQVISRILSSEEESEINTLLGFDTSYYSVYTQQIDFILKHFDRYQNVPDVFTFNAQFPEVDLVRVDESIEFLIQGLNENKQRILLLEMMNTISDQTPDTISDIWKYVAIQLEKANMLDSSNPMNIVSEAEERSEQIKEFSTKQRIPTGFAEIDKIMYGGFSTVEELVVILARTNSGKSWICTKMMETAQKNGFPCLYYSPEMQSSFLATRFDTWRGHFKNSDLYRGIYPQEYEEYISKLKEEEIPAIVVEDKDIPDGVSVRSLTSLVKRHGIKLLIIDGLSYMTDDQKSQRDYDKYKHIASGLFNLSKQYGCAIVVVMQANRATKDSLDNQGEPFPSMYNAEGSDHPCRIATQVFAVRQTFETHTLDIRLEKSRTAANTKPVFSYSWEVNTGHVQYMENPDMVDTLQDPPTITIPSASDISSVPQEASLLDSLLDDNDFNSEGVVF